MPFFQGSQRLSHNFKALAIFLKGFDFLSFISQRYVHSVRTCIHVLIPSLSSCSQPGQIKPAAAWAKKER